MAIKYASSDKEGRIEIHHAIALNKAPSGAIKLTDEEYELIATGKATITDGEVKTIGESNVE